MSAITEASQALSSKDGLVTLYQLDATALGDTAVRCFTAASVEGTPIKFGGITYTPVDIEATGFEWSGQGAAPSPTIKIANSSSLIAALVWQFDDLVGAKLTRIRTFRNFLDDGSAPDPLMRFPLDIFTVERKVTQNKVFVEFELSVPFDQEGGRLPGRQCLKDTCTHVYRYWNGSAFDYTKSSCPYTGTAYFNNLGVSVVNASQDICGKRLSDCQKRFPSTALPTRAFPGMQRYTQ